MQKNTPARTSRRSVRSSRRRQRISDAVVETLEQRQLLTTYIVDKTVDLNDGNFGVGELTLREAVSLSNSNAGTDTIQFNIPLNNPQFLLFSGALAVTDSVIINGTNLNGAGGTALVNANNNSSVWDIAGGSTVSISNMTIRNGRAANGGGIVNAGNLTLSNVLLTINSATSSGGGIYNTGTVTINSGSIVSSNNSSTTGGGIYNAGGTVNINSATLQSNTTNAAGSGGGVYSSGGSINLTAATVTSSSANDGAGFYISNTTTLSLTNSTVSNNNAIRFGGGIYSTTSSSVIANGSTISGNSSGAAGSGGGIYSTSGSVSLTTSTVSNNLTLGSNGGGIRNAGTLNVTNSTISGNTSNSSGGGIYNTASIGIVTLLGSTVSGNTSVTADGGGIENTGLGTIRALNSTISGNNAANRGGGIHFFNGTGLLVNATITNNRADADNNAAGIGGGIHLDALNPNVTTNNTIISGNFVGAGATADDIQKVGGTLGGSYNVVGPGGSGGLVDGVNNNKVGVDAMLAPLANNGGLTLTHALLPISPAINSGSNALAVHPDTLVQFANDQRGGPRVIGASVDVGAFEVTLPLSLVVEKTVDLNDGNFGPGELTLREAIFLSNSYPGAYNIVFNVPIANPLFQLFSGTLSITSGVTIDGTNLNGAGGQVTVNASAASTAFTISGGAAVTLQDMTIRNGRASNGGGINNAGNLTLTNAVVTQNSATAAGGGIYNTGTVTLNGGSIVSSNNASTTGGGIYTSGGSIILNGATVQSNTTNAAGAGGGVYLSGGSLNLTNSTITTNSANDGAGVYDSASGSVTLTNSTISSNNSVRFGGGIYNTGGSSINLSSSTISGNSTGVSGSGGGIYSLSGTITVNNSTLSNNSSLGPNGGGIRNQGTLNVTSSTISGNSSNSSGAGIYNTVGTTTILSSTLSGNTSAIGDGGGIENTGNGTTRVLNSTISGNSAANRGGGIHAFNGTILLVNTTITNNRADSDNNATGIGGGLHLDSLNPNVTMNNTIVAGNFVGGSTVADDIQKTGGTLAGSNNLIGTGGSGGLVNAVNGNQVGVANPMLGPLANNGGPTLTHLPLVGSPAIHKGNSSLAIHPDSGIPFPNDQRGAGFPRFLGVAVDVGSVEANVPLTLVVDNTVDLNNGDFSPGNLTLREAVDLANANPGLDTIVFNVAQANPQFTLFSGTLGLTDSVNIDGTNLNGAGGQAIVHGNNNTQIMSVSVGSVITLADMTLRNGRGTNGGALVNSGNVTLSNVVVTANSATSSGGGIYNSGTVTLNGGSIVSSNNASTTGGGIYNSGGTTILNGVTVQANTTNAAGAGGGIYAFGGSVSLTNSTVTANTSNDGAGIYSTNSGSLSLSGSTVSNNNAVRFGGGIYSTATLGVASSTISGNTSGVSGGGGGIYDTAGTISITGSTISSNRTLGPNGGGIRNQGTLSITSSTISGNTSNSSGAGIFNTAGTVTVLSSTISGNSSVTADGGGIEATGNGTLRVLNSTISGNSAANRGGGIHAFNGTVLLVNTTITNNRADSDGNATGIGGGLHLDSLNPNVTMNNTIVAGNFVGGGTVADDIQKTGGTLAGNSNLIGTGGSGGLVNAVNGNQVGVANPMLGPLANNGGPTLTHLPLLGSPAIHMGNSSLAVHPDSGIPFPNDQRGAGFNRFLGVAVDIGSVEANVPLTLVVDNTVDLNNGDFSPGNLTLREAVFLANANPGLDTIFFNVGLANPSFVYFSGSMLVTDSVLIDGTNLNGAGGQAVVNGNNTSVVFDIANGITVTLQDMTVRGGRGSNGAGIINAGNLTLNNVLVTLNTATLNGGGIYNTGTVTLNSGTSISTGNASTTGAGIYNTGTVISNGATIQGNAVSALGIGGGLYNLGGTATFTGGLITANTGSDGAGIYNLGGGTVSLIGTTVSNNSAIRFGGGMFNTGSSTLTLNNALISGNSSGASGGGGGIYSLTGTVSITGSTISNNRSSGPNGGGIRTQNAMTITNSTISGNTSNSSGGGIFSSTPSAVLTITNSTISGNSSVTSDGGGIETTAGATLRLINSTVSGNSAANRGGGIHAFSGTVLITNSTITNNRADSDGNATGIGGGLHLDTLNPNVTMNNTIVAGNFVGGGTVADDIQKAGGTLTGSNNLIGTGGSGGLVNAVNGNIVGVADARLGPLANNGGPTMTHQLLTGSAALNAGSNALAVDQTATPLATDQRGQPRIATGTVDIGAVEFTINLTAPATVNEGSNYSLTIGPVVDNAATITDYRIDWGDGNIDNLTAAQLTLAGNVVTHVYVDDNPTGTASDPYAITLSVSDAFISPSYYVATVKNITVNNVNPVATISGAPVNGVSGSPINMTGGFTDAGIADTIDNWNWTVTKNGGSVATQSSASASFTYTPTTPGHYIVSLVATDDDTGMSVAVLKTIHVSGAQIQTDPTDGSKTALFVYGTAGDDSIELIKLGASLVRVKLNSVIIGTFAPTGRVIVQGGTGNDNIIVTNVVQNTMIFGGDGNDTITAIGGDDVLVGGNGDDSLTGGAGDDFLIGGDGADNLNGGADEDILIAGSSAFDAATLANMTSLASILGTWSASGAGATTPLLAGNVTDDSQVDNLVGGAGNDLFYAHTGVDITDAILGDTTVAI